MSYSIPPKILVYGASATGKSWGLCNIPANKFVIDGEGGTLPYRDRFQFAGPEYVVDDPFFVRSEVAKIMANPGDHTLIAIDPITTVWQRLVDMADEEARKNGKRTIGSFETALNIGSWGPIKKIWRGLIADLRRATIPVIVTCREKIEPETGTANPDCEKNLRYEFDTVLRVTCIAGKRFTTCDRDRWGRIPTGSVAERPWHEVVTNAFQDWWGHKGDPAPRPTEEMCSEFNDLTKDIKPEAVIARLKEHGVDKFEDLRLERAEDILAKLRSRKAS